MNDDDLNKITPEEFVAIVDSSFLLSIEKDELKRLSSAGITEQLWRRFDDLLIAALQDRRQLENKFKEQLNAELQGLTVQYEKDKRIIDQELRDNLINHQAGSNLEIEMFWNEYHRRLQGLQEDLLAKIHRASKTILQQVTAVVSDKCPE